MLRVHSKMNYDELKFLFLYTQFYIESFFFYKKQRKNEKENRIETEWDGGIKLSNNSKNWSMEQKDKEHKSNVYLRTHSITL